MLVLAYVTCYTVSLSAKGAVSGLQDVWFHAYLAGRQGETYNPGERMPSGFSSPAGKWGILWPNPLPERSKWPTPRRILKFCAVCGERDGFTLREVVIHGGGKKDLTGDGNGEVVNPRSSQKQKAYVTETRTCQPFTGV